MIQLRILLNSVLRKVNPTVKKLLLIISLTGLLHGVTLAQNYTLAFGDAIKVANGTSFGKVRPQVDLLSDGTPVVLWSKTDGSIFVSRLNDTTFTAPVRVNPVSFSAVVLWWTGPTFEAVGDTLFVVYEHASGPDFAVYCQRSLDGGLTFEDTVRVDTLASRIARYPFVAASSGRHPLVSYMGMNSDYTGAEYEVARSEDAGMSFAAAQVVSLAAPGDVCDCCTGSLAVQGDRVAEVFRNNDNNQREIWAATSADSGHTFAAALDVDASNWTLNACPSSGPQAYIGGDSLAIVFMSGATSPSRVWLSTLDFASQQTGPLRRVDDGGSSSQNFPAIGGRGDTLALVWEDARDGSVDAFIRFSLSGPAGLQGPAQNAIPSPTTGNQRFPDVTFSNGFFHIVYQDEFNNGVFYRNATLTTAAAVASGEAGGITISPQPAGECWHVQLPSGDPAHLVVRNVQGITVVDEVTAGSDHQISVASLEAGLYFIEVMQNGKSFCQKGMVLR